MWNSSVKTEDKKREIVDPSQSVDKHLVPKRSIWIKTGNMFTTPGVKCFLKLLKTLLIISIGIFIVINEVRERKQHQKYDNAFQTSKFLATQNQDLKISPKTDNFLAIAKHGQHPENTLQKSKFVVRVKQDKNPERSPQTDNFLITAKQGRNPESTLQTNKFMIRAKQDQLHQTQTDTFLVRGEQSQYLQPDTSQKAETDEKLKVLPKDVNNNACDNIDQNLFTDIGYALLGYNIFRGYPLAGGHDPGFTRPIFKANYKSGLQTADCRFKVPDGLFVMPDIACETSFSSETIKTQSELSRELSFSAKVEGGGWGAKFSASAGYRQSSSEITNGESVLIVSSAKCKYYFSKLMYYEPPEFDDFFVTWLQKLSNTNNRDTYFQFFDTFGTHFPNQIAFGARFVYQHKMSSSKFETDKRKNINVAAEASYAGLFSFGGGTHMDASQKKAASDFLDSVETKTITVGAAPPADGNAMTWASEVASDPIPMSYKLSGLENLCTYKYMKHLKIDYKHIKRNILSFSKGYCSLLLSRGELNFCKPPNPEILLKQTRLLIHYRYVVAKNIVQCADKCRDEIKCKAITFCTQCLSGEVNKNKCYMYDEQSPNQHNVKRAKKQKEWQSIVFPDKSSTSIIRFRNTAIIGLDREIHINGGSQTYNTCMKACIKDGHCVAFTYGQSRSRHKRCQFYDQTNVKGLDTDQTLETIFI